MAKKVVAPIKEKELICITHDQITSILEDIDRMDFTEATISGIVELQDQLREYVKEAKSLVADAKERGVAMEARLYEYHNAIKDLGFTRDKK